MLDLASHGRTVVMQCSVMLRPYRESQVCSLGTCAHACDPEWPRLGIDHSEP